MPTWVNIDEDELDKDELDKDELDEDELDKDELDKDELDKDELDEDELDEDELDEDEIDEDEIDEIVNERDDATPPFVRLFLGSGVLLFILACFAWGERIGPADRNWWAIAAIRDLLAIHLAIGYKGERCKLELGHLPAQGRSR
jgi:hypothetical protein